jgi:cyclomaltodextrinase / maltogenic alpha-amylase / neopullulanase
MKAASIACVALTVLGALPLTAQSQSTMNYANIYDQAEAATFATRDRDWRNGAISYQVLVDRFAPSAYLENKRGLYPAPKKLRTWDEVPKAGTYLEANKVWSHEIDFWGGDLQSLSSKLGHVQKLGVDVLYLNPIHLAYTNHKYDALDYNLVSPEFGNRDDAKKLFAQAHKLGLKVVLDGVFNHMGRNSKAFQSAQADPKSPYRDWFVFGPQFAGGARAWALAENLPELNLENPAVRDHIYNSPNSVVRSWLRDGSDGWRLDVAWDLGFNYMKELTDAAHAEKPGSLVIGEIPNYPREWHPSVDALLHFTLRHILLRTASGQIEAPTAGRMVQRMVSDTGIENMLKSWLYLDNHDTPRLATALPDKKQRDIAQVMQFTLPGAPNLYYGSEVGMVGGDDPEMRAPMRWDLVKDKPEAGSAEAWTRALIQMHQQHRALRVGNFRLAEATKLLVYERYTDRAADTVLVLINPLNVEVRETVLLTNSKLMDDTRMINLLADQVGTAVGGAVGSAVGKDLRVQSSLLNAVVPPQGFLVLKPEIAPAGGYSKYKRVQ